MKINFKLLGEIRDRVFELFAIVRDKTMEKKLVLEKIDTIIKNLKELNTVAKLDFDKYLQSVQSYMEKDKKNKAALKDLTENAKKTSELVAQFIKKQQPGQPTDPNFFKEFDKLKLDENKMKQMSEDLRFDVVQEIMDITSTDMHINFTRQRKRWVFYSSVLFRSFRFSVLMARIILSASFGFLAEILIELAMDGIPKYLITLIGAIVCFFTIEKVLDKKADHIFWNAGLRQTVVLTILFNWFVDQIASTPGIESDLPLEPDTSCDEIIKK